MTYAYLPDMPKLSILIPCYNEEATIDGTLDAVAAFAENVASTLAVQVVTVDDASRDRTAKRLEDRAETWESGELVVARHSVNRGKGAAIQTAREHCNGDIVIIQDADLEYDPIDIPKLIQPILEGRADAVLGTRFGGAGPHRVLYFWHRMGNGGLTFLSNMFTNLNLTDMEVGYKAFRLEVFRMMRLTNQRFGIEPEIVARLSQMGARVYEVPISYHGRTYAEGKKITWRDGVAALGHILRAHFTRRSQPRLPFRMRTPVRAMTAIKVG
ncbi:MAG TPA: glycosyltransferase family 2 protein [Gemmatimonadaceae bacterium]|nr:glycosyltransferase family 2 protein [Gemmatimonadaceae bacterium]